MSMCKRLEKFKMKPAADLLSDQCSIVKTTHICTHSTRVYDVPRHSRSTPVDLVLLGTFLIETKIKYKFYTKRLRPEVQPLTVSSAPFFKGKVPLSYNNNNISFICVTIGSYTIVKALR